MKGLYSKEYTDGKAPANGVLAERKKDVRENRCEGNLATTMGRCTLDDSDDETLGAGVLLLAQEGRTGGILEDFPDPLTGPGRTLQIAPGADLLSHGHALTVDEYDESIIKNDGSCRTSSGVTGFWLVFLSSSTTRESRLRSFLQPTRMTGRPAQKCCTSEIH